MKQPSHKAKVSFRNILAVIQGYGRLILRSISKLFFSDYRKEQIIWRRTQAKECMNNEYCTYCGCEMIGKTMEDRGCEDQCYPDMMNKKQWKEYKQLNNIKLFY